MTSAEYILYAIGNNEGEMPENALSAKLQHYGLSHTQLEEGLKECMAMGYLVTSAELYRLTRLGAGIYNVIEHNMPAWPMDDVRSTNKQ